MELKTQQLSSANKGSLSLMDLKRTRDNNRVINTGKYVIIISRTTPLFLKVQSLIMICKLWIYDSQVNRCKIEFTIRKL